MILSSMILSNELRVENLPHLGFQSPKRTAPAFEFFECSKTLYVIFMRYEDLLDHGGAAQSGCVGAEG